jgi:hypothetical protein
MSDLEAMKVLNTHCDLCRDANQCHQITPDKLRHSLCLYSQTFGLMNDTYANCTLVVA